MLLHILFIISGFLSGGILYSVLVARIFYGIDITANSDDGNPGATNVFKYTNTACGIIALVLDILKGFVPVYAASAYLDIQNLFFIPVLIAPVLGHALAPLFKWHGGKAIAVSFGCMLGLIPNSYLVFLLAFFLIIFTFILQIKPNSLRCMISYLLFLFCSLFLGGPISIRFGCALIASIVIIKHLMAYEHKKVEIHIIPWNFWKNWRKSV